MNAKTLLPALIALQMTIAALTLGKSIESFSEFCKVLIGNPDYSEAVDLIQQVERVLQTSYEELLRKMQLMGQTSFRDELKSDSTFWTHCENEWGKGSGYRSRIASHNEAWFNAQKRQELEKELRSLIEREWISTLQRVTSLLEKE